MVRLNPRSFRMLNQDGAADTIHSVDGVDHVGAYLREARENTEVSVADVAETLRIRRVYLQAIEDGRFEELPGTTYAVGFVRSYATYLRLDVPQIVERFKREASGIDDAQELEFPAPVPEGGFPGGVVVTLSLVLAAVGFGGWYWWQNQNNIVVARVPPPNEAVTVASELPLGRDAVLSNSSDTAIDAAGTSHSATAAVAQEDGPPVVISAVPPVIAETALNIASDVAIDVVAVASVEDTRAAEPMLTPATTTEPVPKPGAEPEPPVIARSAGPNSELNVDVALSSVDSVAARPRIPANSASLEGEADGRTYGAVNRDARIVLTVLETATWVQVMDSQQNALLTQMLGPGDRYLVPNRPGLRFRTNNAGGLDILVDDVVVPSIGRRGDVRHDVRLDPSLLKSGAAVIE